MTRNPTYQANRIFGSGSCSYRPSEPQELTPLEKLALENASLKAENKELRKKTEESAWRQAYKAGYSYKLAEAAAKCGMSERNMRRKIDKGEIRAIKVGKYWAVNYRDVQSYVQPPLPLAVV